MLIPIPTLPPGWSVDHNDEDYHTVLRKDVGGECLGWVSIDWSARNWQIGWTMSVPRRHLDPYEGRGWKARLLADALASIDNLPPWRG